MIIISILRISNSRHDGAWDYSWEYLMVFMQSCIAITMAAVAAFRSVFVESKRRHTEEEARLHDVQATPDMVQQPRRLRDHIRGLRERAREDEAVDANMTQRSGYLPKAKLEGPKMKGVLTFMNNNYGRSTQQSSTTDTEFGSGSLKSTTPPVSTTQSSNGPKSSFSEYNYLDSWDDSTKASSAGRS